ncbi:MAG: threonine synthase [Gaiellaceae bacterium]
MGVIERYRDRLPVGPNTPALTLGEGSTPLVAAPRLSEQLGVELFLKCEAANPTGSFKDRGMAVAVAKAVEAGVVGIVCASTGNTAASAAAYAARAGLPAIVLHPAGAISLAKQAQARAAGARVLEVRGTFDDALRASMELADSGGYALVNSLDPNRIEGQKTAAFEVVEELGRVPDVVALPYGGGGNTCAYAKGFGELGAAPRLVAVEAVERADTLASAIRISDPVHRAEVDELVAAGRAEVVAVTDGEIIDAWRALARSEGVFCEPASAAGVAALNKLILEPGALVVCVLTGHGLKDPAAVDLLAAATEVVDPRLESILEAVG